MANTTKKKAPAKRPAKTKKSAAKKAATKRTPKAKATAPKATAPKAPRPTKPRDPRLPAPGSVIEKSYKGEKLAVQVTADGFLFRGKPFRSLTAIAMAVTGATSINGPLFFGIAKRAPKATEEKVA